MDISLAKMRIDISKQNEYAGNVTIEGLRETDNCHERIHHVAVASGRILNEESISHDPDDNPVHDVGFVQN